MAISRRAFYTAVTGGDLPTVFFSQPDVRLDVSEAERFIASTVQRDLAFQRGGRYPWYYTQEPPEDCSGPWYTEFMPGFAVRNGHDHILEWLFSSQQQARMGATLALILPSVMAWARNVDCRCIETLVSSPVFHALSHEAKSEVLYLSLCFTSRVDVARVLLAHGASVEPRGDGSKPLQSARHRGRQSLIQELVRNGALEI